MSVFTKSELAQFCAHWLLSAVMKNKVKCIAIVVMIILLPLLNCFPDKTTQDLVINQFRSGEDYVYVTKEFKNGRAEYSVKKSEKELRLVDGYIVKKSWDDTNLIVWIPFVVGCIILAVGIFSPDEDFNWDLQFVFRGAVEHMVRCELEDGMYHYFVGNRLVGSFDRDITKDGYTPGRHLGLHSMVSLKLKPVWKTKTDRRGTKLDELGI